MLKINTNFLSPTYKLGSIHKLLITNSRHEQEHADQHYQDIPKHLSHNIQWLKYSKLLIDNQDASNISKGAQKTRFDTKHQ